MGTEFAEPLYEESRDTELLISCLYWWGMPVRIAAAGARDGNRRWFENDRLSLALSFCCIVASPTLSYFFSFVRASSARV